MPLILWPNRRALYEHEIELNSNLTILELKYIMNDAFKNIIKMKNNVDILIIVQRQNYNKSAELEHYQNSTLANDRESKLG
jgi:hypothetical protein